MTHRVAHLGNFLQRHRMGPQVLHPDPVAAVHGLGQLFAQLVAVGAHHVLDVRSNQARNQRMDVIDVVRVGGEQVPLALEAGDAVVVVEHGLQAVALVALDRPLHVLHGVFPRVCVLPCRGAGLGTAGIVA